MKALITGATRGLGRALAVALARDGWELVLDARHGPSPVPEAVFLAGDVADPAHRAELLAAAGDLDLLVNNASTLGTTPLPPLADYSLPSLERAFAVNLFGPLALIQGALPSLRARGGAIVNLSSDAATQPYERWGGYGATKAALDQLSNVLAAEEPSVTVWWVDPGEMRTELLAAAGEDAAAAPPPEDVAVPALLRLIASRPPSGRYTATALPA